MSKIITKIENIKLMQTNFYPDNRGVFLRFLISRSLEKLISNKNLFKIV